MLDEPVAVARSIGDKHLVGFALVALGGVLILEGNIGRAQATKRWQSLLRRDVLPQVEL